MHILAILGLGLANLGFGYFLLSHRFSLNFSIALVVAAIFARSFVGAYIRVDLEDYNAQAFLTLFTTQAFLLGLLYGLPNETRRAWWPRLALFFLVSVLIAGAILQLTWENQ